MLSMYIHLLLASYFLAFHTANAVTRNINTNAILSCYPQINGLLGYATLKEDRQETNLLACDFPVRSYHNPFVHNFTYGNSTAYPGVPLEIEFNETVGTHPFGVEGHGIVISEAFNGYHARELITSSKNFTIQCEEDPSLRVFSGEIFLAVFDHNLLSDQTRQEIRSVFTVGEHNGELFDVIKLYQTTLNSTGLVCFGEYTTQFTTVSTS